MGWGERVRGVVTRGGAVEWWGRLSVGGASGHDAGRMDGGG